MADDGPLHSDWLDFRVDPGMPSVTAMITAAARAIATHDPDPSVRNPDWLAEHFLGSTERQLLAGTPWKNALEYDYRHISQHPEIDTLVRGMLVRTRFIDERLSHAIDTGATQVVVLGAGFDSRACRMRKALRGATVFEVDFGATQEYKKRRVIELLGSLPANVVYVPIDFTRQELCDVLQDAGHRLDVLTCFIWEGVSYYLPEETVRRTLGYVATSKPGSVVVADFIRKSVIDHAGSEVTATDPPMLRAAVTQLKRMADVGEAFVFGIPDGMEAEFLRSTGLHLRELLPINSVEATKLYRTRKDGTLVGNSPPTDYSATTLLEAAVPER